MILFINICIAIASIGVAIYAIYATISYQRSKKKYEKAKKDLVEVIQEEYSQMLGKGDDGAVYYDWAIEILKQHSNHQLFSLDEAIEKIRKAYALLEGDDKLDAEYLLCHTLFSKFLDEDYIDKSLSSELDGLFEHIAKRKKNLNFQFDRALFHATKGYLEEEKDQKLEDMEKAHAIYSRIEERYPNETEEEKANFELDIFYEYWSNLLFNMISHIYKPEYLDKLYHTLEKRRSLANTPSLTVEMEYAQFYAVRYIHLKDEADLKKAEELYEYHLNRMTMNRSKSKVYYYWGQSYNKISLALEDNSFLNKAKDKFLSAINIDIKNIEATKSLAHLLTYEGLKDEKDEPFTQALNLLLGNNEKLYIAEDSDIEEYKEILDIKFQLLTSAIEVIRSNEVYNPNTPNRTYSVQIGDELIALTPTHKLGYIIKAEGLLFSSVTENKFDKNKKKILKLLQTEDKSGAENYTNIIGMFDSIMNYTYAGYYAQIEGEDEQVYKYIKEYLKTFTDPVSIKEQIKEDPLFARYKHNKTFDGVFEVWKSLDVPHKKEKI